MTKRVLSIGVIGALAALMIVSLATAQPGGGAGGPGGGGGRGMGGGMGMMGGRGGITQETLGATADEWKVLEPKVTKVQTLSQQLQGGGRGGRGGRGMGGDQGGAPAAPETELSKARASLQALVGPEATGNPTPDQITKALAALRQAREKSKSELASAQADLKKVVTPKQEAILVLRGLLD